MHILTLWLIISDFFANILWYSEFFTFFYQVKLGMLKGICCKESSLYHYKMYLSTLGDILPVFNLVCLILIQPVSFSLLLLLLFMAIGMIFSIYLWLISGYLPFSLALFIFPDRLFDINKLHSFSCNYFSSLVLPSILFSTPKSPFSHFFT